MHRTSSRFALSLSLILGLCVRARSDSAPAALTAPPAWQEAPASSARDSAGLAVWWRQFNDPTLDSLIERALRGNPDVRTAGARVEQARARLGVQNAASLPSLNGSVTSQSSRTRDRSTDVVGKTETARASLDANWELDLFGRQRAATQAARADLQQSEANDSAARVALAAEVATSYVNYRAAEERLAVVRQSLATFEETYQFTQWQAQAGTGSELDTDQARTNLEQTRASLPSLELTLTTTRLQLEVLCGDTPGALNALLSSKAPVPAAAARLGLGIPAETLAQRPDVRAAASALEAAKMRRVAAQRDRFPSLNLSGSIGVDALRAGKLFDPASIFSTALASLSAPLFSSGKITRTIELQAALEKEALIAYESTVVSALSEVEKALSTLQRQQERLGALEEAEKAAQATVSLAELRYRSGDISFLTVLEAQRTRLALQDSRVTTSADLTSAYIQLYKSLGGGWSNL